MSIHNILCSMQTFITIVHLMYTIIHLMHNYINFITTTTFPKYSLWESSKLFLNSHFVQCNMVLFHSFICNKLQIKQIYTYSRISQIIEISFQLFKWAPYLHIFKQIILKTNFQNNSWQKNAISHNFLALFIHQ